MSNTAQISVPDRDPRRSLLLPATIRINGDPIDVEIVDLSTSGFRARSTRLLAVGSEVVLGWAGGDRHAAIVTRGVGDDYGFEFRHGVPATAVQAAKALDNVVPLALGVEPSQGAALFKAEPHVARWRASYRLLFLAGAIVATWSIIGLIGSKIS